MVCDLKAHIVLTPASRREIMTPRVVELLRETFAEVCGRHEVTVIAFDADTGHAHLLVAYPPKLAVSKLVMSLKTISSMQVRRERWPEVIRALRGTSFWSPSYAAVSADSEAPAVVKKYVEDQQLPNKPKGRPRSS